MADTRTSNSIKNSGATIIGRIAAMMMEFVLRTVLIRCLGIQYGGISTLFTDILQVLSLVELGLGGAIIYALYKPLADNDYEKINALMHFYRVAYNIIALVIFVLGLCFVPFLNTIVKDVPTIKEDIRIIYILYIAATASSYLVIYKETLIKASQLSRIVVKIETTVRIVFIAIESICLYITRQYMLFLVLRVVANIVRNILISLEVKKRFPEVNFRSEKRLTKGEKQHLGNDIGAMALYKISGVALNSTDSIIVSAFLGTGIVGILGQYRMITNFIANIFNSIWSAVLPSFGNLASVEDKEKQYSVFKKVSFGSFLIACLCTVGLFVLINPVVELWVGRNYTVSIATVSAIAFNMYLVLTILPFQTFRNANGLFVQGKYRPLIMSGINIVLSLALVRPIGLFGVLLATPISRLLTQTWFDPYLVYKHVFKKKPNEYFGDFIKHSAITIFCALCARYLLNVFSFSNVLIKLIIGAIISIFIPMAVYIVLYHNNGDFKALLKAIENHMNKAIGKRS